MADFTLNTSTLAGGPYKTQAFEMTGAFREIQLHFSQSVTGQDMEPHFFEFHFDLAGVSKENL